MAQDEPKPLFVRLLLFVVGGGCALIVVTMAIFIPLAMVADWGGGSRGRSVGGYELLVGLSILAAGFGLPHVIFARDTVNWKWMVGIPGVLVAGLIWAHLDQAGDLFSYLIIIAIAVVLGMGFFFSFRALSGRAPPQAWRDMP